MLVKMVAELGVGLINVFQVPGFQCCLGGEELRRASTTLSGVSTRGDSDDVSICVI